MRVTSKGQVTIPKEIRQKLRIVAGSEVEFVDREGAVVLRLRREPAASDKSSFKEWARGLAGKADYRNMDGKAYVDWLRGPRDDLDLG
jgi:AbrB family looped-hinge helix DNA binding protein